MAIAAELYARVKAFADAEGLSVDAFVARCVEEIVTYREATERELDAQEAAPVQASRPSMEGMTNAQRLAETRRQTVEGMRAWLSKPDPEKQARAEAEAREREERARQREAMKHSQDAFKAQVLAGR